MPDNAKALSVMLGMEEGLSLRQSCEKFQVKVPTFLRWVDTDDDLADQYGRARARLMETHVDDIISIADDGSLAPEDRKVRIDARKWVASKLAPKKYGDKLQVDANVAVSLTESIKAIPSS